MTYDYNRVVPVKIRSILKRPGRPLLTFLSSDEESEEEEEKEAKPPRKPPAKKQKKEEEEEEEEEEKAPRVDLGAGEDVGELVRTNDYGEWRTVPGFTANQILVSSKGWLRTRGGRVQELSVPYRGCQHKNGYCNATINGNGYQVHLLILRAFKGPWPKGTTGDHIAKYAGDKMRERSDNQVDNLRYATLEEQRANQGERKDRRDGKPILVRCTSWPATVPWRWFQSANQAHKAIGVTGLNTVANPKASHKSCFDKDKNRWIAKWAPALETQDDLPADPAYVDAKGDPKPQPDETWRKAVYSNKKPLKGIRVSNRGRLQCKEKRGTAWGHKFTPKPTDGKVYATIGGSGKPFHIAVFCSFDGVLKAGETVDHIDVDETNNLRSNLRAATKREQVLNRTYKDISERQNSQKHAIEARRRNIKNAPWLQFESQSAAARELGVLQNHISEHLKGERKHVGGYIFRRVVVDKTWEDDKDDNDE